MPNRRSFRPTFTSALFLCLVIAAPATGFAQTRPLKILLTNDDGFESAGLKVMHAALKAAGHQVTVVAPAVNQSSTSMSMTSGAIKVEDQGNGVYAVHGTPADAAMIGLSHILRGTPQDLVVSGTNAGQNIGSGTNTSGTVSAAIAASRTGVPAIATSAGIGGDSASAYAVAAELVNQMIALLDARRPADGKLLPDRVVINMNVPSRPVEKLLGVRWTPLSRWSGFGREYSATETAGEVRSRLTPRVSADGETDTDLALFVQGYVTLTLLDGDVSIANTAPAADITGRLSKLALPQPAAAR
jgi:5'/3'-nucleotidase SurE